MEYNREKVEEIQNQETIFEEKDTLEYDILSTANSVVQFGTLSILAAGLLAIVSAFFVSSWLQTILCLLLAYGLIFPGTLVFRLIFLMSKTLSDIRSSLRSIEHELVKQQMNNDLFEIITKNTPRPEPRRKRRNKPEKLVP